MESLGNKLRCAREAKKETHEDVSRKINVSARYLSALEKEDFSVFPGEVYAIGFLKSYGSYLGLNTEELVTLYRAVKMQEQPVPMEQLVKPKQQIPMRLIAQILGIMLGIAVVAALVYLVMNMPKREPEAPIQRATKEYTMGEGHADHRLLLGDSLVVPYNGVNYQFTLTNVGEAITIASPMGDLRFDLGQEVAVDMDNDGFNELTLTAADFVKNSPDKGARLHFAFNEAAPLAVSVPAVATPIDGNLPSTVIFSSPTPYPFTMQINFQGHCLFRWEIIAERDRQGRNESYVERSEELSIQAQNGIRIGVSNALVAKIEVIGGGKTVPVELGAAGEVVVAEVRWIRTEDNRYQLVLARLE